MFGTFFGSKTVVCCQFLAVSPYLKKNLGIWIFGPCLEKKDINLFEPAHQILHLVWPRSAPACFKLIIILSVLKLNFRLIFCPILALNFNFRPNSLKLLLFHLNKSTHLSSRTNQALFKYYISIFPLALARPVFELQKCYLDENCSEFNQEFIAVLRPGLSCTVQKLR